MSYFFTTIIGVIVGAAIVLVAKAEWKSDPREEERRADNPRYEQKESIQKQIENFLNYDGSASGQVLIGDDE